MRRILLCLSLLLAVAAQSSCASPPRRDTAGDLDSLFARLRATDSDSEAKTIEVAIRHVWAHSAVPDADALMIQAIQAMRGGDYDTALDFADKVVELDPTFAEGWNLRATVHYMRDDYGPAVSDIGHVLSIEPRHYAALAGLGKIMLELDDKKAALWAFERALSINPHLDSVREEIDDLREELAGLPV
ncbi:MAG: tetratricopeptide repeat protein [Actinomycetota bacterium]